MENVKNNPDGNFISVIIPVFNEVRTIGSVVEIAVNWQAAGEIIVVDDGSTDGSGKVISQFGDKVIYLKQAKNRGKGAAVSLGIEASRGNILILLDADCTGLTHSALNELVGPLITNHYEMSLGIVRFWRFPKQSPRSDVTGFRAIYKKNLIKHLPDIATSGYGVEAVINSLIPANGRIIVDLPEVFVFDKLMKEPKPGTLLKYLRESFQIYGQMLSRLFKKLSSQ